MVTTTVAHTPPALPTEPAGLVSTYSQNACPQPVLGLVLPESVVGAWARRCLRSIWPCRAGIVNRPWQRPWPSSTIVKDAAARAACSSASSTRASWASPISGATTSRIRRPSTRNAFASWSRACSRSTASASATTAGSVRSAGRASIASTMTAAWSTSSPPVARAVRTGSCASANRDREPGQPVGLGAGHLRGVGPPGRRRGGALVEADLDRGRVPGDPELELGDLGPEPGQLQQRRRRLVPAHRPQRHLGQVVQTRTRGGHEPRDPVPRIGTQHAFGHDPSQAPPPTVGPAQNPLSTRGRGCRWPRQPLVS